MGDETIAVEVEVVDRGPDKLEYRSGDRFVPIPPHEVRLQTIDAVPFSLFSFPDTDPACATLEGLAFDRAGDLFFCVPALGRIYRLDMATREPRLFCQLPEGSRPTAAKFHRDGRLFAICIMEGGGSYVAVIDQDGKLVDRLAQSSIQAFDDMVFDHEGGFYLSDLSSRPRLPI